MPSSAPGSSPGPTPTHVTPPSLPQEDLGRDPLLRDLPRDPQGRPLLGRIPLVCRIGKGGMGSVYYAIHPRLQVEVAVKVLPFHLLDQDPKLAERFSAEARMAAGLSNHHIVRVLDVDQEEGTHYLVMEYVSGESAGAFLKRMKAEGKEGLEERDAIEIVTAAAKGLAAAHERGIIHRDIKPDNILIPRSRTGTLEFPRAKVADLGLAKPEGGGQSLGTLSQVAMGTPGYMAPEQIEDARSAGRPADVFSMGATLYGLLSGQAPFRGTSLGVILRDTMTKDPDALPEHVSAPSRELIFRCLAKDPAGRPSDGGDLLRALESILPRVVPRPVQDATIPFEKTKVLTGAESAAKPGASASKALPTQVLPVSAAGDSPARLAGATAGKRGFLLPAALLALLGVAGAAGAVLFLRKSREVPGPIQKQVVEKSNEGKREVEKSGVDQHDEARLQTERRDQRKHDFDATSAQAQGEKDPNAALALWKLAATMADTPQEIQEVQARIGEQEALLARKREFRSLTSAARAERDIQKRLELWQKAEGLADTAKAREEVQEQIKEVDRLARRKRDLDALSLRAQAQSDPAGALNLWKQAGALAEDPKDIKNIQIRMSELEALIARKREFESVSAQAHDEPDAPKALTLWQKAAGLADLAKDREEALRQIKDAERKLQRRREFEAAWARAQAEKDPSAALPAWKQASALADNPKDMKAIQDRIAGLDALVVRKREYDAAAEHARAEKDLLKALELWQKAVSLADGAKDLEEAKGRLNEISKASAKAYYDKGAACCAKADYSGAIEPLTKAIELDPSLVFAYSYRGLAKQKKNDFDGAIEDFTRAIELDPKYATGYANRGATKYEKRDLEGAIGDFSKAIELEPNNALHYRNRGNIRLRAGDRAGGTADLTRAAQLTRP